MKINERHRQRSTAFTLQEKQHPCIELFFSTPLHIEIFHYVVRPVGGGDGRQLEDDKGFRVDATEECGTVAQS